MRIATIDLGTNTCHLLIAEMDGKSKTTIYEETIPIKLGEGGITKGIISKEAIKRTVPVFDKYRIKCQQYQAEKLYATATAAVRQAKNKNEIITAIKNSSGIKLNIIDGEKEASLIHQGVKMAYPSNKQSTLIMDIGGGSVEFIITANDHVYWKKSYPTGAAFLLEKFNSSDPISTNEIEQISNYLNTHWHTLKEAIKEHTPEKFIGASGSFKTLCDLYHQEINSVSVAHTLIKSDFEKIASQLIQSTTEKRLKMPGMKAMRVEMIVYAVIMINFVLKNTDFEKIFYSNYALKEGLCNLLIIDPEHDLVSDLIFVKP